jgi:ubiquinone/menaquinone biosynthesis C-methylase UbiE
MTNMNTSKRTIEVACGPGKHSLMLANTFLNENGGVLVSCDISGEMVKFVQENYASSDWAKAEGNKF